VKVAGGVAGLLHIHAKVDNVAQNLSVSLGLQGSKKRVVGCQTRSDSLLDRICSRSSSPAAWPYVTCMSPPMTPKLSQGSSFFVTNPGMMV
jgi:hypothetical protein